MNMLIYLIPIALLMGGMGLLAFLWSLKSGQYDDLQGAAWRILADDETDQRKLLPHTGSKQEKADG
ncbi:cbb3-type cytochrome oxidase assembly protein CcoS [Rhizobium laguerreae]|nr:cbb3-type cytochrome oxidase assembly protein CcoS [Rhizobium laguerreae]MBY3356135.1 cbb3-type cytochrome oxidase assembly protein CcoS [Rhizobium laguerreae]MBY3370007.1 cbb3-type cytochrome oxidase assembly protein CcoS [Rhizobium laguerreae]MBY3377190.1 cbb3-type cytochrome oxidase assembly protein CcoS [Rhizobium laguerreae]MBY3390841.1 cbb3-type cytochrome oxidase assembly protein CcoS [Rhizobium laguerreae]